MILFRSFANHAVEFWKKKQPRTSVLRVWAWEIALILIAIALITALVVILAIYDGMPLPQWPHNMNLNTIAALLTLAVRASLAIVAAEIIGQSKWMWLSDRERQLLHFQTFDDAGRGLLGSLRLIVQLRLGLRGSPLAAAAALTTVLSLAISPFTQQAIKTVPCPRLVPGALASAPIAFVVPGPEFLSDHSPGSRLRLAMISSISRPRAASSTIQSVCPSGNCTFPELHGVPHSTIGVCSQCQNTSSLVDVFSTESGNATYPNTKCQLGNLILDWFTMFSVGNSNLSWEKPVLTSEFMDNARHSFANISLLSYSNLPRQGRAFSYFVQSGEVKSIVAVSCTIYPCLKHIKVRTTNGKLEQQVLATVPARPDPGIPSEGIPATPHYLAAKSPCAVDHKVYDAGNFSLVPTTSKHRTFWRTQLTGQVVDVPSDCLFGVGTKYAHSIGNWINQTILSGTCRCRGDGTDLMPSCAIGCSASWMEYAYESGQLSSSSVDTLMQDLATGATDVFQLDGWGALTRLSEIEDYTDGRRPKAFIKGEMYETTVCVKLDWPWLLLPGLLCLTTMTLLVIMLLLNTKHQDQPVWKCSILPLLFFGLDAWGGRQALDESKAEILGLAQLERQARAIPTALDLGCALSRPRMIHAGGTDRDDRFSIWSVGVVPSESGEDV
ncbi:hypothetical protein CDD83_7210 [Cordyceps sp. RAO-2017]|nr:hypothetical protein CDD83_7210 [Cordyceps sp. RAO-2017]